MKQGTMRSATQKRKAGTLERTPSFEQPCVDGGCSGELSGIILVASIRIFGKSRPRMKSARCTPRTVGQNTHRGHPHAVHVGITRAKSQPPASPHKAMAEMNNTPIPHRSRSNPLARHSTTRLASRRHKDRCRAPTAKKRHRPLTMPTPPETLGDTGGGASSSGQSGELHA